MNNEHTVPSTLIFLHIPKTAGTTFKTILRKQYPSSEIFPILNNVDGQREFESLPVAVKSRYRVLHGHIYFGIHEHLSQPSTYLTILRHPIKRVLSSYYFIRERPHLRQHELAQQMSLEEFVSSRAGLQNGQTRMLSGIRTEDPCTPEMLEKAKYNLANCFSLVGLTERFDETVILAKHTFNWSMPYYVRRNKSNRPEVEELPESAIATISEHNQFDLQLYDYARQLFEEQLRRQPPEFRREVEAFQWINRYYGLPFYVARFVKRKLT